MATTTSERPEPAGETWSRRQEATAVLIVVAAALCIRLYFLRFHDIISADGTSYAGVAKALRSGNLEGLATSGLYPVLVLFMNLFVPDVELAGRLVSVVSGSLLVIPLYLLGKAIFNRQTALAACILTLTCPPLVSWSCEVMTQATYITFTTAGIYFVWRMFGNYSAAAGGAAGICLGLACLTRPEGILLFVALPLIPLLAKYRDYRQWRRMLAVYGFCFLLLYSLNLVLLRYTTGVWQLSGKTSAALNDALSYYLQIYDLNYIPGYTPRGYLDIIREFPDFIWKNSWGNLKGMGSLLPVTFWAFALIGLLRGGYRAGAHVSRLFLFASFAPLFVIIVFYYTTPEYTQPYLPVLFLWIAEGFRQSACVVTDRIARLWPAGLTRRLALVPLTVAIAAVLAAIPLVRQVTAATPKGPYDPRSDQCRRDHKNMGLLLKQHLPPGKIMTRWARIAFYADREWVNIPNAGLDEVLREARESGARFIVVDGGLFRSRPELGPLLMALQIMSRQTELTITPDNYVIPDSGLRPYLLSLGPETSGMRVYEIVR
jgi:4-amino-4-deoxy-L-arabinose transferase-like glycosyltransferase